jgi:hypothetical protein
MTKAQLSTVIVLQLAAVLSVGFYLLSEQLSDTSIALENDMRASLPATPSLLPGAYGAEESTEPTPDPNAAWLAEINEGLPAFEAPPFVTEQYTN